MDTKSIISKITLALLEIEKSESIKIDFGFNQNFTGLTLTATCKDNISKEREDALNLSACRRLGFTQNVIGVCFNSTATGQKFKIVSIAPKNRKYPVIAENLVDGRSYKFSVQSVKKALGGDQAINRYFNLEKLTKNDVEQ
jgi:hypothetical protein